MSKTMSMIEARKKLTSLPEQLGKEQDIDAIAVTRRGKPVLAVMPWDVYETLTETLEIMADKALMAKLKKSIRELEAGKAVAWEDAKRERGL
jgi:PHD/YefM family antitoxin component YafN of YafNO toxin-antitoxin module